MSIALLLLMQQSMARDEQAIESLEQQWQVQLNSNDSSLWRAWQSSLSSESSSLVLSKELGCLSFELDQYAYQLDQVRFSSQWRYRYWKSQRESWRLGWWRSWKVSTSSLPFTNEKKCASISIKPENPKPTSAHP
jgi:hypothetical protein